MSKLTDSQRVIQSTAAEREDGGSGAETETAPASRKPRPRKRRGRAARYPAAKSKNGQSPPAVRQGTKQALLIDLLKRKIGATLDEAVEATGWQPHSVRGAISGTIKKKLGFAVTSEDIPERGRVYRIAADSIVAGD